MFSLGRDTLTFTKVCTVCMIAKPLDDFYNRRASEDGKAYRCKLCDNLAVAKYREIHKDKYRELQRSRLRKCKYGLTDDSFRELVDLQNNKCAICKTELQQNATNKHSPETLCVDHDHKTGKVRGLLCTLCNKALGLFKDDPSLVENALGYLKNAQIH